MARKTKALIRSLNRSGTRTKKTRPSETRTGRLAEPTICDACGAVFSRRVWRRPAKPNPALLARARWTVCPACRQVGQQEYLGRVLVRGGYLAAHEQEIVRRIHNVAVRGQRTQPERRIVSCDRQGDTLEVLTTSQKLAHRIGHELRKAFGGRAAYRWADDGSLIATWHRA